MHPGGWLQGVGRQLPQPQGTGHPQTVQSCFTIMEGVHSWSRQLGEPVRAGTGKKYERKHGGMVTLGHDVGTCCEESVLKIADWDIGMHWLYEQLCHSGRPHVKHGQDSLGQRALVPVHFFYFHRLRLLSPYRYVANAANRSKLLSQAFLHSEIR